MIMADYSELPQGIPRKIAVEHLPTLDDVEHFRGVCRSWRSEINDINHTNFCPHSNTQIPWLMLADSATTTSFRRFYSLPKHKLRKIDFPGFRDDADDERRYFSSKGWLIAVTRKQGIITFFDPFRGHGTGSMLIYPPRMPVHEFVFGEEWDENSFYYQVSKFIFSISISDDLKVAMIFNAFRQIAFWRPGQQEWAKPVTDFEVRHVEDVCFFRGVFYSIDHYLRVISFGEQPRVVVDLRSRGFVRDEDTENKNYIVPLGEERPASLLVVTRHVVVLGGGAYWTKSFDLVEVNVDSKTATRVADIGNRALFVGHNSTFFVEASGSASSSPPPSRGCGCRPNCIYFTDDNTELHDPNHSSRGGGDDMGVYSLEENRVVELVYEGPSKLSFETPPTWVELPHH